MSLFKCIDRKKVGFQPAGSAAGIIDAFVTHSSIQILIPNIMK